MPELFHFQHPQWLWALAPLTLVLLWLRQRDRQDSQWRDVIDRPLQPLLLTGGGDGRRARWLAPLGIGWLIATIALADPVWQRKPQPVFQTDAARVIVLDLSRSMTVADLKPSRMARARYKVEDILNSGQEGLTGLVVFAGDAFTVTPLTRDVDTIRALLPSLEPAMMPVQGSRADLGLLKGGELLRQSGNRHGQIILIADGGPVKETTAAARKLAAKGYRIDVIGVGTPVGGPIPGLHDAQDKPIIVPLQEKLLRTVASVGGGRYLPVASGADALQTLLAAGTAENANAVDKLDARQQQWRSNGPYLTLLLIPLAALAFRRGWLVSLLPPLLLLAQPGPLLASPLDGLWLRQDQRADRALRQGQYQQAEKLASDPLRKGSAAYREGRYQQALQAFSQASGADADYNRGNALARLGRYEEAIKAYDQALAKRPGMQDAIRNREAVRKRLEEQRNTQKQNNDQSSQQQSQQKQQQGQSGQKQQKQNSQQKQSDNQKNADKTQSSSQQQSGKEQNASEQQNQPKDASAENPRQDDQNQFKKAAEALKEQQQSGKKDEEKKSQAQSSPDKNRERQQQQAQDKKKKASPGKPEPDHQPRSRQKASAESVADKLSREEKMAAEQWLRRIPDDPGGLLRRKFQYQYNQRQQRPESNAFPPW